MIDLDGVLNDYNGNFTKTVIPPIKKGAKEFLENISKNYNVKIFTTREKSITLKWLKKYELDKYISEITAKKEVAFLYIDDRCITFNNSFEKLEYQINHFKTYWE